MPRSLHPVTAAEGTAARFVILGESGGRWIAVRGRDRRLRGQDDGEKASAAVTITQDVAWRLWTKGISPDDATPPVEATGSPELVAHMLRMVSIIA